MSELQFGLGRYGALRRYIPYEELTQAGGVFARRVDRLFIRHENLAQVESLGDGKAREMLSLAYPRPDNRDIHLEAERITGSRLDDEKNLKFSFGRGANNPDKKIISVYVRESLDPVVTRKDIDVVRIIPDPSAQLSRDTLSERMQQDTVRRREEASDGYNMAGVGLAEVEYIMSIVDKAHVSVVDFDDLHADQLTKKGEVDSAQTKRAANIVRTTVDRLFKNDKAFVAVADGVEIWTKGSVSQDGAATTVLDAKIVRPMGSEDALITTKIATASDIGHITLDLTYTTDGNVFTGTIYEVNTLDGIDNGTYPALLGIKEARTLSSYLLRGPRIAK